MTTTKKETFPKREVELVILRIEKKLAEARVELQRDQPSAVRLEAIAKYVVEQAHELYPGDQLMLGGR